MFRVVVRKSTKKTRESPLCGLFSYKYPRFPWKRESILIENLVFLGKTPTIYVLPNANPAWFYVFSRIFVVKKGGKKSCKSEYLDKMIQNVG